VFARSYGVNGQDDQMPPAPMAAEGRSVKLSALAFPERLILIAESNQGWSDIPIFTVGGASFFCGHRRKANFAFCDGHVKTMTWAATGRPFNLWQIDGWDRPAPASLQANLASVDKAGR
jgi:prepilin-type processing-associated H-X9-DG protein